MPYSVFKIKLIIEKLTFILKLLIQYKLLKIFNLKKDLKIK
jgi:hypothetical protein